MGNSAQGKMVFATPTMLTTTKQCSEEMKDARNEGFYGGQVEDTRHALKCFTKLNGQYTNVPMYHTILGKRYRIDSVLTRLDRRPRTFMIPMGIVDGESRCKRMYCKRM